MNPAVSARQVADVLGQMNKGEIAPNVALLRLLIGAAGQPNELRSLLEKDAEPSQPLALQARKVLALWDEHPAAAPLVASVLKLHDEGGRIASREPAEWGRVFDDAVDLSEAGSVALYSLGSGDLLDRATAEIVEFLKNRRFAGPDTRCLDLGCGIGRVSRSLGESISVVVGVDVSERMVRTARERAAGCKNIRYLQTKGRDLAEFENEEFTLVLALDSFPYIVAGGQKAAEHMLSEIARVLAPGGKLVIGNYSYREDISLDASELGRLAERTMLRMEESGLRPFSLWDGIVYVLGKPAAGFTD